MRHADPPQVELLPELRPVARELGRRADGDRAGAETVMTSASRERRFAIAAADGSCPRCGAARTVDQSYCLQCGDAVPVVSGRLASLRRRCVTRIDCHPAARRWGARAALALAAAGAGVAVPVSGPPPRPA